MMNDRPITDDFDTTLRRTLLDVSDATSPDHDLAARLVANAREGRPAVVSLASHRRAKRWALPLLAAASIVALAVGGAVVSNVFADRNHPRPQHSNTQHRPTPLPSPTPVSPTPTTTAPPAVPHFRAVRVYFLDAQHGWALGDAKCAASDKTDCATLLATTDGGGSWHPLGVPHGLVSTFDGASCGNNGDITGPCVDDMLFANADDGYLWSAHEFYWTTDGGRSWTRETNPASGYRGNYRMAVVGQAVVRLAPSAGCSVPCRGVVERAALGSSDWRITTPGPGDVAANASVLGVVGQDVYLFAGGTAGNMSIGIFGSSDGGRTWSRIAHGVCGPAASDNSDPFYAPDSAVADDGALVASCLGKGIRVAAPGTSDFGSLRPFPAGLESLELLGAASAEQMSARLIGDSPSRSVQVTIYLTSDGGRTWRAGPQLTTKFGVQFDSGTFGHALEPDGTLIVTHDGGQTWQAASFPG